MQARSDPSNSLHSDQVQARTFIDARPWNCVDFVSDVHLNPLEALTAQAFWTYLQNTPAQAVFILGDLFEVWIGDDVLSDTQASFERECVQHLRQRSTQIPIFFMPGNRDFLLGQGFYKASGLLAMQDPCVLELQDQRCLLSHGDEACLSDTQYQAFRTQVRSSSWQTQFLGQPLVSRREQAQTMRNQSQQHQLELKRMATTMHDLDPQYCIEQLKTNACSILIHGHTHQACEHELTKNIKRIVLSDWCMEVGHPQRTQVLRHANGEFQRIHCI